MIPDLHPFFAHFPAALLTVSLLFEAFALFMNKGDLERAGRKSRLPQNQQLPFVILFAVGVVVMLVGAFLGGELVYRYGAGLQ